MTTRSPTIDRVRVAVAASLLAGVAAGSTLALLLAVGWSPRLAGALADGAWTARSRAWFTVRGTHAAEVRDTGHHDTWTTSSMRFTIPHLNRSQAHTLTFLASADRPDGLPLPAVTVTVDNQVRPPVSVPNGFTPFDVLLPARADDRAVVVLQMSETWNPGDHDDRRLGLRIREVALAPANGHLATTWSVVGLLVLAVACVSIPLWLVELPRSVAVAGSGLVVAAFTAFTWLDGAFLGPFPDDLRGVAIACLTAGALVGGVAVVRTRWAPARWLGPAAVVLVLVTVKLALFSHPLAIIGDGIFQVHRAQLVTAGQYYFTSITPRPFFEFPYAIALYVAALPFWSWVPRELDRVWLLRVVTLLADAAAGVTLAAVAWRAWSPRAALYVAALWPFARAPFEATSNANLTNAFGQGVFAVAMAALAWTVAGTRFTAGAALVSAAVLTVAFLSHFSTLSVGMPLVGLVMVTLVVAAERGQRVKSWWVAVVLVTALVVSYGVYYRQFHAVYRQTVDRVMSEAPVETQGSSIAASPLVKLRRWATGGSDDYGLPGAPLAAASAFGVLWLFRERRRDPWTLILAAWLATWITFTALGILTSVQMRVNLVAAPAFVCLGAYAMARAHDRTSAGRGMSLVMATLVALDGVRLWLVCLGV